MSHKNEIFCRKCNKLIGSQGMSKHLKQIHGVVLLEYISEHIEDFKNVGWRWCSHCGKLPVKTTPNITRLWASCSDECKIAMMSKMRTGRCTNNGYRWTEEQRQALSATRINQGIMVGDLNPSKRPEIREKMRKAALERASQPDYVNPMVGKTHTTEALRKIFSKRSMTKPEKKIAELLDSKQIKYYSQFFLVENKKAFSYDFKIKDEPIIIEVDGDYWHGGPGVNKAWFGVNDTRKTDKQKDEAATSQGYKVLRLWESDIEASPEKCLKQIEELL